LLVRVSVRRAGNQRHNYYVTIEQRPADDDTAAILKALTEFRRLHGPTEQIVAIDLYPNS
jgi:hypothetical protein